MKNFKKTLLALMLALTLGLGFQSMAYAAPTTTPPATPAATAPVATASTTTTTPAAPTEKEAFNIDELIKGVGKAMSYINLFFTPIIYFFTFSIGNFLDNDYIFANEMGAMLQNIWVVMRNLVNIIFVFILLVGAFKQILGVGEKSIKDILPKFAILLIAVNFSWLAGKVILDASNVISNVVFAIPSTVETPDFHCDLGPDGKMIGNCMPSKIMYTEGSTGILNYIDGTNTGVVDKTTDSTKKTVYYGTNPNQCPTKDEVKTANVGDMNTINPQPNPLNTLYKKTIICWQKMDLSKYEQNNASMFMMFSVAKVQSLTEASISKSEPSLTKVTIASIFTIVIQLVYIISFLALYVLMVARIVILWLFMAFSPLIVLFMIGHDFGLSFGGAEEKLSLPQFINWAFAPAKVGAVMTIGFLMIMAGQKVGSLSNDTGIASSDSMTYIETNTLFSGIDNLQQFIWLIMVTVIIWMGTWSVLHGYEAVNGMLHGIKESFEEGGKLIGKAPFKVPFMPIGGKMRSLRDLTPIGLADSINEKIRQMGSMDAALTAAMSEMGTKLKNNITAKENIKKSLEAGDSNNFIVTLKSVLEEKHIKYENAGEIAKGLERLDLKLTPEEIGKAKSYIELSKPKEAPAAAATPEHKP